MERHKCQACQNVAPYQRKFCWRCINMKKRFGITGGDYDNILRSQNGQCAICEITAGPQAWDFLHIDHNHLTGEVRGLLCPTCNTTIGQIENAILEGRLTHKALDYIKKSIESSRSKLLEHQNRVDELGVSCVNYVLSGTTQKAK